MPRPTKAGDCSPQPPSRGRRQCGAAGALVEAGLDVAVIDTAHGHSDMVLKAVERVKSAYPDLALIAGNVVTAAGTRTSSPPAPMQ